VIKSRRQYEVTRQRLAEFESALAGFDPAKAPPGVSERGHRAVYAGMVSVRDELADDLAEYDRLKEPTND
jgi:hypothetical protein